MPAGVRLTVRGLRAGRFVIALAAVIIGLAGYVGWVLLRPDPYSLSERVVRDARREISAEVRESSASWTECATRSAKKDVHATIEKHQADAIRGIDDAVDGARDRLSEMDISIRTQRNRLDRIDSRAEEAKNMVNELATEAKQKAQGS
jgi:hypothetical protein